MCCAAVVLAVGAQASVVSVLEPAQSIRNRTAIVQESAWRGLDGRLNVGADLDGLRVTLRFGADPTGAIRTLGYGATVVIAEGTVQRSQRPTIKVTQVGAIDAPRRLARATAVLRKAMGDALESVSQDRQALARGLIFGDDRDLPTERVQAFRNAGMSHLTAVSGQNVAYAMAIIGSIQAAVASRRRALLLAVAAITFGFVVGWQASVRRAVASACIVVFANRSGRSPSSLTTLAVSIVVCVVVDPMVVQDFGFRLSCAAVAGLSLIGTPLARRLPRWRGIGPAIAACVGAQVATAPIIWSLGGQVSLASVPANVIGVPMAGVVMAWGLAVGPIAAIVGGVPQVLYAMPINVGTAIIDSVATVAAAHPVARLTPRTLGAAILVLIVVNTPVAKRVWVNAKVQLREAKQL
jgi:competence protein ComEC